MYRIVGIDPEYGEFTLYNPTLHGFELLGAKLNMELNTSGQLIFKIPKSNKSYGYTKIYRTRVNVYSDEQLIFTGRAYAPTIDVFNDDEIECEGCLAYLNDTYQPPFDFFGEVRDLFSSMIETHNQQLPSDDPRRFILGDVTVVNSTEEGRIVRSSEDYMSTMDFLKDKFIDSELGGYIHLRYEPDGAYIDYLSEETINFVTESPQNVEQSVNLLEATTSIKAEEFATSILPLGDWIEETIDAGEEGEQIQRHRLTLATPDDPAAITLDTDDEDYTTKYGKIVKIVTHDDITTRDALLRAAKVDLANALKSKTTIDISAADLSKAGYPVDEFALGTLVNVKVDSIGLDERMVVKKLSIDLLSPESFSLSLSSEHESFVKQQRETNKKIGTVESNLATGVLEEKNNRVIGDRELHTVVSAEINETAERISSEIKESVLDETEALVSEQASAISQTVNDLTISFTNFQTTQNEFNSGTQGRLNEYETRLRIDDDGLTIAKFQNGNIASNYYTQYTNEGMAVYDTATNVETLIARGDTVETNKLTAKVYFMLDTDRADMRIQAYSNTFDDNQLGFFFIPS